MGVISFVKALLNEGANDPKIATLRKTEGSDTIEVQRMAKDWGLWDLGASPTPDINSVATQTFSAAKDCLGKSTIKVKVEYSDSAGTVSFRIHRKDASGNWGASGKVYSPNTGQQGGAGSVPPTVETDYYHGVEIEHDVKGATEYKIEVTEAPSAGNVSAFGDAV